MKSKMLKKTEPAVIETAPISRPRQALPAFKVLRGVVIKNQLILFLSVVLIIGFLATSMTSFFVSRTSIRQSIIENELPLTTDNIYSEIQKDLIRPVFISSMMASDTFLRDWVLNGEQHPELVYKYLKDVQHRSMAFTSFFVSESSLRYYYGNGSAKILNPHNVDDRWYFRVRQLKRAYELNVDRDLKLTKNLIVFVNHRMFDYQGKFIGVTGVGITVHDVQKMLDNYQNRYQRNVYFINEAGEIVLSGDRLKPIGKHVQDLDGVRVLSPLLNKQVNGNAQYQRDSLTYFVNIRYVPELKWYLVVEKNESDAISSIRHTLFLNLFLCAVITLLVLCLTHVIVRRYQQRIQYLSTLDGLTRLPNRRAFDACISFYIQDAIRHQQPLTVLILDIDFFKRINDRYGHLAGDYALQLVADILKKPRRATDFVCRWGGEEFLVVLKECPQEDAVLIAESIRCAVADQVAVYHQHTFSLTLSAGVATLNAGEDLEQWLSRADQYLYEAKRLGRNRVVSQIG
ncbi:MAG: hypothetical protein RLY58_2372 [Pseudomonadota bacterium]